jgi:hypothetical protein
MLVPSMDPGTSLQHGSVRHSPPAGVFFIAASSSHVIVSGRNPTDPDALRELGQSGIGDLADQAQRMV